MLLTQKQVKIIFINCTVGTLENEIETMWATTSGEGFRLDNIPFYAKGVSYRDIVSTDPEEYGFFYFKKVLKRSGHRTVRLLISEKQKVQGTCKELHSRGCIIEISDIPTLISVDIPPEVSYEDLLVYLEDGDSKEKWGYEEACLGFEENDETYSNHSFGTSSPSE